VASLNLKRTVGTEHEPDGMSNDPAANNERIADCKSHGCYEFLICHWQRC
jgi:hypothetical protein